jgi:4,5-DOPA dioxygenase extradiol
MLQPRENTYSGHNLGPSGQLAWNFPANSLVIFAVMSPLKELHNFSNSLSGHEKPMPVFFIGHGSPMNGIEDNEFSRSWADLGKTLTEPAAVLCISAHWLTNGTFVTAMESPRTIHDFYGFPQALFNVRYPAPGSPALAQETASQITGATVGLDHEWGLDHGTWSVVRQMYPEAKIPVLQLSIDYDKPATYHYELARELSSLRKKGVLIIGSGNMVHNLRMLDWQRPDSGFDWAEEMNLTFKSLIESGEYGKLTDYARLGPAARLAVPTPDHYFPLMYALGLKGKDDSVAFFNDKLAMGSVSMTSVKIF